MDNAIEAAKENQGDILLLLMQQESSLTIVVENYAEEDVDIDRIGQQGQRRIIPVWDLWGWSRLYGSIPIFYTTIPV